MSGLIFDTHAHYDDPRFDGDRSALLEALFASSVSHIVNIGTNGATSAGSVALAEQYPAMYAAVGIYPHETAVATEADFAAIAALLDHPKTVAIGEIGLDFHYDDSPKETQLLAFRRQMELARETGYPVVIHDREAHGPCMEIVQAFPEVRGIFHSFSGSAEMAKELVRRGWMLSFSGSVTFKNAVHLREAAKAVPLSALLVETDAPYLAPVPMRGQTNRSDYIGYTAAVLAELQGVSTEALLAATHENACRIFRLDGATAVAE